MQGARPCGPKARTASWGSGKSACFWVPHQGRRHPGWDALKGTWEHAAECREAGTAGGQGGTCDVRAHPMRPQGCKPTRDSDRSSEAPGAGPERKDSELSAPRWGFPYHLIWGEGGGTD